MGMTANQSTFSILERIDDVVTTSGAMIQMGQVSAFSILERIDDVVTPLYTH